MATADPFNVPRPENPYLDALVWGSRWDQSSGPITYDILHEPDTQPWSGAEAAAARTALRLWAEVAAVQLVERDGEITNLNLLLADLSGLAPGVLGLAVPPDGGDYDGLIVVDPAAHPDWLGQLQPGGYSFVTLVHEIGHALGLAHPHDDGGLSGLFPGVSYDVPSDTGTYGLNTQLHTIMSYNNVGQPWAPSAPASYGLPVGPMAFDIAAIQWIYGANMATRTGNDSYLLPTANVAGTGYRCIWDAGGTDRIAHSGAAACRIDLREAPLVGPHAGGYLSRVDGVLGGFTIAHGVLIERADGGGGDDILIGNAAANLLIGGAGRDRMLGGAGNDVYWVDNAGDTIVESASGGTADLVRASLSYTLPDHVERLVLTGPARATGNDAANLLMGSTGSDTLVGGGGDDTLVGGAGADDLFGGAGLDLVTYVGAAAVSVRLGGTGAGSDAAGDRYSSIEIVRGSEQGDRLYGAGAPETLLGGAGADTLFGYDAADRLLGHDADDRVYGGNGNDTLDGGDGADRLDGGPGNDLLLGGSGDDLLLGGLGDDRLFGGDGLDLVYGGDGADHLFGRAGGDVLVGGDGGDRLHGEDGADRLRGGAGDDTLLGGEGDDVAYYTGLRADYAVTRTADGVTTVRDLAPLTDGDDGIDWLLGVELLRFADATVRVADLLGP
jgi:serralysin